MNWSIICGEVCLLCVSVCVAQGMDSQCERYMSEVIFGRKNAAQSDKQKSKKWQTIETIKDLISRQIKAQSWECPEKHVTSWILQTASIERLIKSCQRIKLQQRDLKWCPFNLEGGALPQSWGYFKAVVKAPLPKIEGSNIQAPLLYLD